jgi:hypothetical protein
MKVTTNLKSGNWMDDALSTASNLGDQASGFLYTAEQQAQGFTSTVANTANTLWQDLTGLFGR